MPICLGGKKIPDLKSVSYDVCINMYGNIYLLVLQLKPVKHLVSQFQLIALLLICHNACHGINARILVCPWELLVIAGFMMVVVSVLGLLA